MAKAKKLKLKLFLLFFFTFIAWTNYCFAREVTVWPTILRYGITDTSTLPDYIVYFAALGTAIGGAIAVISVAIGGIQLILSAENPENTNLAKDRIRGAFIGLIILVGAYVIIGTINPAIQTVKTEPLAPLNGLQLTGSNDKTVNAPMSVSDMSTISQYQNLSWPGTVNNSEGQAQNNCDPNNPNAVYVVYWFSKTNFNDANATTRLTCGGRSVSLSGANSYVIVKEQPGVYFYSDTGCHPPNGKDSSFLPTYSSQSIPQWTGNPVKSIRIVNGPDPKKGPFYGVVWFDGPDYKTAESGWSGGAGMSRFEHFAFSTNRPANDDNSTCISDGADFGPTHSAQGTASFSYVIYKWAGFKDDGTVDAGTGVTLYSGPAWTGGTYDMGPISDGKNTQYYTRTLNKVPVMYSPNTTIPETEQKLCQNFDPSNTCLQSFEIKGNFLVLVSSNELVHDTWKGGTNNYTQAYPISPRIAPSYQNTPEGYSVERGTPEIASDYITSGYANYMEVIPLAASLVAGQ